MLELVYTTKFLKDAKLAKRRGWSIKKLEQIINLLAENKELPKRCRPHILSGDWDGFWECHIESDWVLIYKIKENKIYLTRMGTHSDLF